MPHVVHLFWPWPDRKTGQSGQQKLICRACLVFRWQTMGKVKFSTEDVRRTVTILWRISGRCGVEEFSAYNDRVYHVSAEDQEFVLKVNATAIQNSSTVGCCEEIPLPAHCPQPFSSPFLCHCWSRATKALQPKHSSSDKPHTKGSTRFSPQVLALVSNGQTLMVHFGLFVCVHERNPMNGESFRQLSHT